MEGVNPIKMPIALFALAVRSGTAADAVRLRAHIRAVAGDPARAQDSPVDARRHGPEIIAFADVRPDQPAENIQRPFS